MKSKVRIYLLSMKYWLQGNDWREAKHYAEFIVKGFNRH